MAKITRIKASDGPRKQDDSEGIVRKRVSVKDKASKKAQREKAKADAKKVSLDTPTSEQNDKSNKKVVQSEKSGKSRESKIAGKKPFVLFRPFVALGHYLRDSWHELRQVRWPNRKMTWQMLVAVILYAALFMVIISLLDLAFSGLSNLILNR